MKEKIRYQSKADLKGMRQIYKMPKEFVAEEIGYSVRSLERIEAENAVVDELTARRLCDLYKIDFSEQFYKIDIGVENWIKETLVQGGEKPNNVIDNKSKYYYLYVRKQDIFKDCVAGKGLWVRDYKRNKEIRRLREVDAKKVLEYEPNITIINNSQEWKYWYYKLCIGKMHKVVVSEACMKDCLPNCLEEVIVKRDELMSCGGVTDIMFLGVKKTRR